MSNAQPAPDRTFAEHSHFMHALARALLRDEAAAEDVVQDTWVALLQRGPVARVGAWMGRVVQRTAGRWRRTDARRGARERRAARGEALPSTLDTVARAELVRAVGEAVAALEAPYRDVLLLRYYDGLAPREIAPRLGLPLATVKSRLQRAQERVRARLRQRAPEEWLHALGWLAFGDPRRPTSLGNSLLLGSTTLMKLKTLSLLCLALLLGLGTWWFARPAAVRIELAAGAGTELERALPPAVGAEVSTPTGARAPLAPAPAAAEVASAAFPLHGHVRDPFGRAVPAAEVWAGARPEELAARVVTDEHGTFELALEEPSAWIGALAAGWAPSPLVEVRPPLGEALELVLPSRGAGLTIRVRGAGNAPVNGARVFVGRREELEVRLADGGHGRGAPGFALTTDAAGVARFTGLAPGWARVEVSHPEHAPSERFLTLWPPEDETLVIELERGFTVEGTVRDERGGVPGASVRAGARTVASGHDGAFRLGPIAAGRITAEDASGRRARAELDGPAGATLRWDARLGFERALRGRVVSAKGAPVADARVSANRDTWPGWSRTVRTHGDGGFELHDCPDEERLRLEVRLGERDELPLLVREDVEADEELVLRLPSEAELAHLQGSFEPALAAGARVLLRQRTAPGRLRLTGGEGLSLAPDVEGSFEHGALPPGEYELVLVGEPFGWHRAASFALRPRDDLDLGQLRLPRPGVLRVDCATDATHAFTAARFLLERRDEPVRVLELGGAFPAELALAPGAYALEAEVQPGPRRVIPFTITAGAETRIALELAASYRQRVRVLRASGAPALGALALEAHALEPLARALDSSALLPDAQGAWSGELELVPCQIEFLARDPLGHELRAQRGLHDARPDEVLELVLEDRDG